MPAKHNDKNSAQDGILRPGLANDLERVAALVHEHLERVADYHHEALALVRVLDGISPERWEGFASTYGLENWLGIPLNCELAEAVNSLLSLQERLAFQRDHDALTGIGNRGYFNRRLETEVERALRSHAELSLIYLDLDNFKQVNDVHGHACGDMVLQRLAVSLQRQVRHYDMVTRVGGEEFAVILPATSCWTAVMLGNRLLEAFRKEEFSCGEAPFTMTFSGGVSSLSMLDKKNNGSEGLVKSADEALYRAKRGGKNTIAIAESDKIGKDRNSLVQAQEKRLLFSGLDSE